MGLTQLLQRDARKPRQRLAVLGLAAGLVLAPLSLAQATSVTSSSIFVHPVLAAGAKISAPFGEIYYEWDDQKKWHYGVDLVAKYETPIYAPADAVVLWRGEKADYGYTVDIGFEDGRKMRVSSLHKILVE